MTETRADGWLLVEKPVGPTSAQVVGKLKHALRRQGIRSKIGHGGTLDPLASGLLPVALGEATKLAQYALDGRKTYEFRLVFGEERTTGDAEGAVCATSAARPGEEALLRAMEAFRGPIWQRPPAYSALKVGGKRAYALARAGQEVELPPRAVTIESLELLAMDGEVADFRVVCSKGTYVRSLGQDLARAAGSVGHVGRLHRTAVAGFVLEEAVPLDKLLELVQGEAFRALLKPLTTGLDDIPVLAVEEEAARILKQGGQLPGDHLTPGRYLATSGAHVPVALVEVGNATIRVVRGFNL